MALLKIPLALKRGTYFKYKSQKITISPMRYNPYINGGAYIFDLSWEENEKPRSVNGIVVAAGVNLVGQTSTPIPSLYALSSKDHSEDVHNVEDINLYIKELD